MMQVIKDILFNWLILKNKKVEKKYEIIYVDWTRQKLERCLSEMYEKKIDEIKLPVIVEVKITHE